MRAARFTCRKLLRQMVVLARDLAAPTAGNRRLARIAMIAMTNKSSRSVKARGEVFVRFIPAWTAVVGNRCARCLSPSRALRRNQRAAYPSPRDAGIPRVMKAKNAGTAYCRSAPVGITLSSNNEKGQNRVHRRPRADEKKAGVKVFAAPHGV